MPGREIIEVKNLVKRYGLTLAVDGLSFSVGSGEVVGFLGPNGAGKSTTMKILTGFLKPTTGRVHICGCDVISRPTDVQKRIGYLPESAPAYQDMEVGAYLRFIASMRGLWPKEAKKAVSRVLGLTGLEPRLRFPVETLSRGFKQRVGLAAALLHDPDVLVLDEPTSGLDPLQIVEIRDVIRSVGEKKTVIFSTHVMQEVEAICNRVLLIDRGRLLADGDFMEIRRTAAEVNEVTASLPLEEAFRRIVNVARKNRGERLNERETVTVGLAGRNKSTESGGPAEVMKAKTGDAGEDESGGVEPEGGG